MREILFRGKQKATGKWLCGDLRQWSEKRKGICDYALRRTLDVHPETVGQFTGMIDKNGKQIFEGDIVKDHGGIVYPVVFELTGFHLKYAPPHSHGFHYDLLPLCNYWHAHGAIIEVIGNIHDNPELLKGDKC